MLVQTVHRNFLSNQVPRILYDGPGSDGCHIITSLRSIITGNHGRCSVVKVADKIFIDILSALLKKDPHSQSKLNPKVYAFSRGCISFYLAMEYLRTRLDHDVRSKIGTIHLVSVDPVLGPDVFARRYKKDLKSLHKASEEGTLGFDVREVTIVSNESRTSLPIASASFNPLMSPIKNTDILFFDGSHAHFRYLDDNREIARKIITDYNKIRSRRFVSLHALGGISFRDVFKKSKRYFIDKYLLPKNLLRQSFLSEVFDRLQDCEDDCGLELFVEGTKFGDINPGYVTKQYDREKKVASRGARVIKSLGWSGKRKPRSKWVPTKEATAQENLINGMRQAANDLKCRDRMPQIGLCSELISLTCKKFFLGESISEAYAKVDEISDSNLRCSAHAYVKSQAGASNQ